jgi:transposase InsO family protein
LIRRISAENPLWGAPRLHGELLKLGFEVAQSSVAKYMVKRCGPPSQGWHTFLRNHAPDIAAMDLFVVPTMGFDLLYVLVIVRLARRDLVWINVTTHPTADWIARQITEAFPWDKAPHYLIRDRDQVYGAAATRRLRAMGIRDKPIAPGSPWQNGFAERLIGSIRRECVDHIVVLGETHLRRVLKSYARYYNEMRTHRSLDKDAPISRPVQRGRQHHVICSPRWTASPLRPCLSFRYTQGTSAENLSPQSTSSVCVLKVGFANQNAHASSNSRTRFGNPMGNSGKHGFAA